MRGGNASVTVGRETSFKRNFNKPQPLRPLADHSADILALEKRLKACPGAPMQSNGYARAACAWRQLVSLFKPVFTKIQT